MSIAALISSLEQLGIRVWEQDGQLHFRAPKGLMTDERRELLRAHKADILAALAAGAAGIPLVVADPASRHDPFPLTNVQAAYLLGRGNSFAYGGVGCHAYAELRFPALDVARLEAAWQALVARHDMLRAVIELDGYQRVLAAVPPYRVTVHDHRDDPAAAAATVAAVRTRLSHHRYVPSRWPLFALEVTRAADHALLHISIDLLIADYVAIQALMDELRHTYLEAAPLPPLPLSFRDALLAQVGRHGPARQERDRAYWWSRLDDLPSAPELPLAPRAALAEPAFRRLALTVAPPRWAQLTSHAAARALTPSSAVLAVFSEVISRWSRRPRFTLTITVLQRPPIHPDIGAVIGDFTAIDLLAVDHDVTRPLAAQATALQQQLWADLDHDACSGIEVLRELARRRGPAAALMPVVYTSALGLADEQRDRRGLLGMSELVWGISQTPQVWIDCQVMERDGALALNWDVRDGVFPSGVVDDMFAAFAARLDALCEGGAAWDRATVLPLPAAQAERRAASNATAAPLPDDRLHDRVLAAIARSPDRIAVIAGRTTLTYGQLGARVAAVAQHLGDRRGERVAIVMERGVEQPIAVLGALLAGAAYVPIDAGQPTARRDALLAQTGAAAVLTQSWLGLAGAIAVDTLAPSELAAVTRTDGGVTPDDLAYVIFTSGSTGTPKGVMVSHRAAANTIDDINRRFAIGRGDAVLGLAELGFDLSVYDLFGLLGQGGRLVLPLARRATDPSHWAQLIVEHGITLLDAVPAQAQMLHDYLAAAGGAAGDLASLRLAMLSGDWIPVALPDQLRARVPGLRVVSLGGATEAAIWSIVHPIGEVQPGWLSIPYGKPLTNQAFHVLDDALAPVPDHVTGELYIAGAGLALGYLHDDARTAERFIRHPRTGERLYRTGDLGRVLPDGNIEFLGREDQQVKVRGHRIELGEIVAALEAHAAVARAVVVLDGERGPERRLVAFVEPAPRVPPPPSVLRSPSGLDRIDRAGYRRYLQQLDDLGGRAIACALAELGGTPAAADAIDPRYGRLIARWQEALAERGGFPADRAALAAAWAALIPFEGEEVTADYFRRCAEQLTAVVRGELDPLRLLFPDGRLDVSDALYARAPFHRWANAAVADVLSQLAARGPLRVLEVGAGAGGTTAAAVAALDGTGATYHATDLSPSFFGELRARFAAHPWVTAGVLDLDEDVRTQGYATGGYDVIVAGDVVHATADAAATLAQLRALLAPGGVLVLVEMTRVHLQILGSLELLARHETEHRSRERWRDLLAAAGGELLLDLPGDDDDLLTDIGLRVFVARFKADQAPVSAAALDEHLRARVPEPMVPAVIQIVEQLPLSRNGKVDVALLRSWARHRGGAATAASSSVPASELEQRVAAIWSDVLGIQDISRDHDFFGLGGDSLLAARLTSALLARLDEAAGRFFDEVLQLVLAGPTVAQLAEALVAGAPPRAETAPAGAPDISDLADVRNLVVSDDRVPGRLLEMLALTGPVRAVAPADVALAARRLRAGAPPGLRVIGWDHGALAAAALATELIESGCTVERLIVVGALARASVATLPAALAAATDHYAGDLTLVRPAAPAAAWPSFLDEYEAYWRERCLGHVDVVTLEGDPSTILDATAPAREAAGG